VEEAAGLLRVGRTKAYDMTREWRANGGKSGLPVLDCSNVLRVPVSPLAEMLGVEVSQLLAMLGDLRTPDEAAVASPTPAPVPAAPAKPTRARRKPAAATNQLDLFDHGLAS
jgi:hypothetical protein